MLCCAVISYAVLCCEQEVGVTLLRCLLVLGALTLPIAASWCFVGDVFLLLRVDPAICAVVRQFLRVRVWSLPADVLSISFSK
jgi:Na+-driven multidrug efflux pump